MNKMSEAIQENLNDDKGYQVFSNLMDVIFELADELYDKVDNEEGLTEIEFKFLDAFDEYIENMIDDEEDSEE